MRSLGSAALENGQVGKASHRHAIEVLDEMATWRGSLKGRPAGRSQDSIHSHPWAQRRGHFRMPEVPQAVDAQEPKSRGHGKRSLFLIQCRSFQELDGWYVSLQEGQ
jgi:hypothetical protein